MEFSVEKAPLLKELNLTQGVVERKTTIPILSNLLLDAEGSSLRISATDLELGIYCGCPAKIKKSGSGTVPAKRLLEIVRSLPEAEIKFKLLENHWVQITCEHSSFKLVGMAKDNYPTLPALPNPLATLPVGVFATMIHRTIFSISSEESRYTLNGALLILKPESAAMVATDGHRLARVEREVAEFTMQGNAIIPRKGLAELRKLLDQDGDENVRLMVDGHLAWLKRGTTEVSMRLIEGEFPDYRGVIPAHSKHGVSVGRDALLAAIKRVSIFSNERYHGLKLSLAQGSMTVSSTSPEMGEASEGIDVDFSGEEFSIGFNAAYLMQGLGVLPPESEAILGLSDEVSPGVITSPADSQFTYVVMPMRL